MTDTQLPAQGKPDTTQLIYILYLSSLVLAVTLLIGVVWAYIERSGAPEWLETHYTFLIHTFWKGILYFFLSFITSFILIGFIGFIFTAVWMIVRCIKGMKLLNSKSPIPNPKGWWF